MLRALSLAIALLALPALAAAPVLSHFPPASGRAYQPLELEGELVGGEQVVHIILKYRQPGGDFEELEMSLKYGDFYGVVVPGDRLAPPGIEYFVEGQLKTGKRITLFASRKNPVRVLVVGEKKTRATEELGRASGDGDSKATRRREAEERAKALAREEEEAKRQAAEERAQQQVEDAAAREEEERASRERRESKRREEAARRTQSREEEQRKREEEARRREEELARAEKRREEELARKRASESRGATPPVEPKDAAPPEENGAEQARALREADAAWEEADKGVPRSELEEELALYTAEDTVALAGRQEAEVARAPAIASTFNREQLAALGARNVYDVLDLVPGLSVSRDVQGFHRLGVRGLRSDPEVLFLLNGHKLNNFFDGRALALLPVENLERIEVVRGPGSAVHGGGALLAVVNVITSEAEELRGAASYGSFGTLDGHLAVGRPVGDLLLHLDADVLRQTGYSKQIDRDALERETLSQGLRRDPTDPAGFTNDGRFFFNVGARARYRTAATGEFTFDARWLSEDRSALVGLFDTVGPDSRLLWSVLLGDLRYQRALTPAITLRSRAYVDLQHTTRTFQLTPHGFRTGADAQQLFPEGLREVTRVGTRSLGLDASVDFALNKENALTAGLSVERQDVTDYAYETNYDATARLVELQRPAGLLYPQDLGSGAATGRLNLGVFVEDAWSPIPQVAVTAGLRFDAIQLPSLTGGVVSGSSLVPSFNPRLAAVLSPLESLVLKVLYGRAFRPPTVRELAESVPSTDYNQGRFEGNPTLRPATVDTIELGAELLQRSGDARVRVRGNLFYEGFSNPIVAVDTTGNIIPIENRDRGLRVFGAEGEARLELSERAATWVNASWFRAQDLDAVESYQLLTDVPQARLNAGFSTPLGPWLNLEVLLRVGAERRNNDRSILEHLRRYKIPGYALVGVQLRSERLLDHVEFAVTANNVFDHQLVDDAPRPDRMSGLVPREGVSAFATVRAFY